MRQRFALPTNSRQLTGCVCVIAGDANHFECEDPFLGEEHAYNPLVPQFTAAWFKLHLQQRRTEFGIDFEALLYGTNGSATGLCEGGDGKMVSCEVHR